MAIPQPLVDWTKNKNTAWQNPEMGQIGGTVPSKQNTAWQQAPTVQIVPTATKPPTAAQPPAKVTQPNMPAGLRYQATQLKAPAQWTVDGKQTVSGQLNTILGSGSALMQQADTQGLQTANSRGLLNSSIAAGASEGAMIAAATPIATADATTYSKAAGYNADEKNQFATTNANAQNTASQFNAGNANTGYQNQLARAAEDNLQKQRLGATAALQTQQLGATASENQKSRAQETAQSLFKANAEASIAQLNNQHSFNVNTQSIVGGLGSDLMKLMTAINADTNMNQQSKDYSIQQAYAAYKANISLISAVGSIPNVASLLQS